MFCKIITGVIPYGEDYSLQSEVNAYFEHLKNEYTPGTWRVEFITQSQSFNSSACETAVTISIFIKFKRTIRGGD